MAGIRKPGLFQLKAAPLGDECVTLILEQPKLNRLAPAFMPRVDNAQRASNHESEDNQNSNESSIQPSFSAIRMTALLARGLAESSCAEGRMAFPICFNTGF
jgi:hypothetical protein